MYKRFVKKQLLKHCLNLYVLLNVNENKKYNLAVMIQSHQANISNNIEQLLLQYCYGSGRAEFSL